MITFFFFKLLLRKCKLSTCWSFAELSNVIWQFSHDTGIRPYNTNPEQNKIGINYPQSLYLFILLGLKLVRVHFDSKELTCHGHAPGLLCLPFMMRAFCLSLFSRSSFNPLSKCESCRLRTSVSSRTVLKWFSSWFLGLRCR